MQFQDLFQKSFSNLDLFCLWSSGDEIFKNEIFSSNLLFPAGHSQDLIEVKIFNFPGAC